ncbi:hypothetical protein DL240_05920 [Lujinxingia litoralis]|uniref:Thiol:disulfide interchange protein DsbD N-terminal domain-containing protein n=2 Tax=Lujinxingia litoralis TaxID=2211119 RepID=A0A328C9N0_9DELT|nr:hypothetical protein DL240_05920 [Lujinxingia litoralis]
MYLGAVALLSVGLGSGCEGKPAPAPPEPGAMGGGAQSGQGAERAGNYRVEAPAAPLTVGAESTAELAVVPGPNLKINLEYPWKIEFEEVEGLTMATTLLNRQALQLSEERATIPLRLTPSAAGEYTLKARGNFSVCNDDRCDILRDEALQFKVTVQDAAEPS